MFTGQVIAGGCVSLTVTVNEQPVPALFVQSTVVAPLAKSEPEAGAQVTVPQVPLTVGAGKLTIAPHWPGPVVVTMFPEQVMVHGVASEAHAENSDVLPFVSVAVAVKNEPAGIGKPTVKFAFPPALVVTFVAPTKVWPWPKPLDPHAAFAKNSIR
jgi:hypothetical protein